MRIQRSRTSASWRGGVVLGVAATISACAGGGADTPAGANPGSAPSATVAGVLLPPTDSLTLVRGDRQLEAFRNIDRIAPTRVIEAGDDPLPLPDAPADFSGLAVPIRGDTIGLDAFIEANRVVGLLVLKNGQVALERYALGNDADTRWVSYSVSKSVVSLLVGAAVHDGYIESLDVSVADYLPTLRGSAYESVTLRQALQMSSGVAWNDTYGALDTDFVRSLTMPTVEMLDEMGSRESVAEPGERYNYNSGEAHLTGTVLRAAIGNNLATYLSDKIWKPFGMESNANWLLVEPGGGEHGGCCFSATLRDYGRLGLFAMRDGVLPNGERVLPEGWMAESLTPSPANDGYGYLWWLRGEGAYAAIGIFGQVIWIDPAEDLVVVAHSAWTGPTAGFGNIYALAEAVREMLR